MKIQMRGLLALSLVLAGCGGLSDDQKQDAANVANAIAGDGSQTSIQLALNRFRDEIADQHVRTIQQLNELSQELATRRHIGTLTTIPNCSSATLTGTADASCSISCNTAQTIRTLSCQSPVSFSKTCSNGITYSVSDRTMTIAQDWSALTINGSAISGSLGLSLSFSANVSGDKLDGKTLACSFATSINLSSPSALSVDCSNFSCTYDGSSISCSDLQSKLQSAATCS